MEEGIKSVVSTLNVLMGVGNPLGGDDAIGLYVARNFKHEGWISIECGTVPEDFTSDIKKIKPDILVIVDAADMGMNPGEMRIISRQRIPNVAFSTHGMPLRFLMEYLEEYAGKILLIGIQPKNIEFGEKMSTVVRRAGDELIEIIKSDRFDSLEVL